MNLKDLKFKHFKPYIAFLLKYPIYYVLVNGFAVITGLNIWVSILPGIGILLMYRIGQKMEELE